MMTFWDDLPRQFLMCIRFCELQKFTKLTLDLMAFLNNSNFWHFQVSNTVWITVIPHFLCLFTLYEERQAREKFNGMPLRKDSRGYAITFFPWFSVHRHKESRRGTKIPCIFFCLPVSVWFTFWWPTWGSSSSQHKHKQIREWFNLLKYVHILASQKLLMIFPSTYNVDNVCKNERKINRIWQSYVLLNCSCRLFSFRQSELASLTDHKINSRQCFSSNDRDRFQNICNFIQLHFYFFMFALATRTDSDRSLTCEWSRDWQAFKRPGVIQN